MGQYPSRLKLQVTEGNGTLDEFCYLNNELETGVPKFSEKLHLKGIPILGYFVSQFATEKDDELVSQNCSKNVT